MARYTGPMTKKSRRLGVDLVGGDAAYERRPYPPGQHGRGRIKESEYLLQLREKQKARYTYGVLEKQFHNYYTEASRRPGDTGENMVGLLETRLDAVVYRAKFAPTPFAARQLVSHGHVMVNGRILTIGSAVLRVGDFIKLTPYAADMQATQQARQAPRLLLPSYLQFATEGANDHGVLRMQPNTEHVPFEFDPSQVAEYYAKLGV